jgi:hypothetical protein
MYPCKSCQVELVETGAIWKRGSFICEPALGKLRLTV